MSIVLHHKIYYIFVSFNLGIVGSRESEIIKEHEKLVNQLLARCESLERKVSVLTRERDAMKAALLGKEAAYDDLISEYRVFKMSMSLSGETQGTEEVRKYLAHMIKEIDTCIAMLNE